MYKRILIANRGEIALRIIRACKELGIETVCVYSTADAGSQYLQLADEAICIGPPRGAQSYLKIDQIISAAEAATAKPTHPAPGSPPDTPPSTEVSRTSNLTSTAPPPQPVAPRGDKHTP